MSAKASKVSLKSKKLKQKTPKQLDPFYDPDKDVRPCCKFCNEPPTKPPLFNTLNLPFTTSTTSASWEGGTCCIRVREIGVSIDPPDETADLAGTIVFRRRARRQKFVYRTPSDLERVRERDYRITLKRTLEDEKWERRLGFQRLKEKQRKLMNEVGPAWYQELSFKQMECMDVLGGTIAADMEEGLVARTQRLLARLGILPSPTNEQVLKAMTKCGSNPIIFLIYLYKFTTEVDDECMEPDSPYSINDRLLLSGLTYLALPMTLFDLHCILPPPPEKITPKPKAKPVPQRESFSSPYLDPQPICLYNGLVDEKIQRKRTEIARKAGLIKENVVETVSEDTLIDVATQESTEISTVSSNNTIKKVGPRFTVEIKQSTLPYHNMIGKPSTFSVAMFESAMRQVGGGTPSETSSAKLPERERKSAYLQNQLDTKVSEATKMRLENTQWEAECNELEEEREIRSQVPDEDNTKYAGEVRFVSDRNVPAHGGTPNFDQESTSEKAKKPVPQLPDTNKPKSLKKKESTERKIIIPEIIITFAPDQPELDYDDYPYVHDDSYEYQYAKPKPKLAAETSDEVVSSLQEEESERKSQDQDQDDDKPAQPVCDCARARAARERAPVRLASLDSDGLYFSPSDMLPCPISTVPALQAAFIGYWSGVRIPPESFDHGTESLESILYEEEDIDTQYEVALELMARHGNILAALPQVEKLPALRRWLRLYKGFKLTPEIKAKLMNKSFGMWGQKQQHPHTARIPSINLKNPSKLDWNCKHWLMDKVNNMFQKYYSNVRKAQVEDAREYWCTMCMEYFKNPAEFRNVYFAYLPSREADVLAVRPWDGTAISKEKSRC